MKINNCSLTDVIEKKINAKVNVVFINNSTSIKIHSIEDLKKINLVKPDLNHNIFSNNNIYHILHKDNK